MELQKLQAWALQLRSQSHLPESFRERPRMLPPGLGPYPVAEFYL